MRFTFAFLCLCILATGLAVGCGDGLPNVGGVVTVDGQLVTQGNVTFYPTDGSRSGAGRIRSDGTYIISYRSIGDGMPPGEYKVAIVADEFVPSDSSQSEEEFDGATLQQNGKLKHIVPKIYNRKDTTPLVCTITEGGSYSEYNLEVTTDSESR